MKKKRYAFPDMLRGILLVNMILYHAVWDMVNIFDFQIINLKSFPAYVWQQSICWLFIILSGFCWSMGKKKLKRAVEVLDISVLITVVTVTIMPDCIIMFGVLSAIGTGMLVMIPLDKFFSKVNPFFGFAVCLGLFIITRNINSGWLGFGDWNVIQLPDILYNNLFTAYLGFPPDDFRSTDYFSVFPWIFLYQTGYFLYHIFKKKDLMEYLRYAEIKPLNWLGRHSLIIYTIHQPVVYIILKIIF